MDLSHESLKGIALVATHLVLMLKLGLILLDRTH